jgi:AcrR family transcriptional regulator
MAEPKRAYDATRRRERAAQERAATRQVVLRAARELFVTQGYVATTVAQIADRAGVALQSVYATGAKADLLHLVRDELIAGDQREVLMVDRAEIAALAQMSDPIQQVEAFAGIHARIIDRALDIFAAEREAAVVDAGVAAVLAEQHRLRLKTYRGIARMLPASALASGLDHDAAADVLWTIASPETGLLLRRSRGWTLRQHESWLARTLVRSLLRPDAPTRTPAARARRRT